MEKGENRRKFSLDSLKIKQFDSEKDVYQNNQQFSGIYNHEQEINHQIEQTNMGMNSFLPNEEQIYSQQMATENSNKQNQFIKENAHQRYPYAEYQIKQYDDEKLFIETTGSIPNPLELSNSNQKADLQGQNQCENNYGGKQFSHADMLEEDDENVSFGDQSHRNKQQNQQMDKYRNEYQNSSKNDQNYYNYGFPNRVQFPFQFKNVSQEYDDTLEDEQRKGSGGITLISQSQLYARDSIRNVDSVTERVYISQEQLDNNQINPLNQGNKQFPFLNQQQQEQTQYQNQNQQEEYDNQFQKLIKMRTCPLDGKYPNYENQKSLPLYNHRFSNEMVVSEYKSQSENLERKNSNDSDLQYKNQQNANMQNLYTFSPRIENSNQNNAQKYKQEGNQNGQSKVNNENKSNQKQNLDNKQDKDNYVQTKQQSDQNANQKKKKEQTVQLDETDQQDGINNMQMKCQIKEHDEEKIIMVCVDPYCEAQYRLCCGFCNQLHSNHVNSLMRLQEYRYKILQSSKILGKSEQEQNKKGKDADKINHKELLYLCMQRQNQLYQEIKKHFDSTFLQIQKLVEDKEKNILSHIASYDEEFHYYLEKLQILQQKDYFALSNKDFLKLFNFQKSPQKFIEHQTINDSCRKKQLAELDDIVYDYYVDLQDIFKGCLEQSNNLLYDLLLKLTSNKVVATQARSSTPLNQSNKKQNKFSTPNKKETQEQTASANRNSQSPLQKFIHRTAKSLLVINNNNHMVEKGIPGHKRLDELPLWCSQMQHVSRSQKKFGPYKFENIKPKSLNLGMQQNIKSDNVYIGDWINFMREGNGIEYSKKDQTYYEGQWKSNLKHGNGRLVCRNDVVYEGQFEGNKKKGYGVLYQFGGKRYEGLWCNDLPNGNGIQYYPNGDIFQGEFQNGMKQGSGTFKYFDGSTLSGSWVKDQANGVCTYFKLDGSKYEGEYKNGKKHGFGTYIWSDGRKYVGHWEYGVQDGAGLYTNSHGITVQGFWKNGKKIQQDDSDFNKTIVR
ncbi:hypothetical protein ABPG72_018273 [Tetrahymena utriculariae]